MAYKPDGADLAVAALNWPVLLLVKVWTFSTLWGWFMVPLGLVAITKYQAFGVLLVWGFFTFNLARHKPEMETVEDYYAYQFAPYLGYGVLLLLAVVARGMFV